MNIHLDKIDLQDDAHKVFGAGYVVDHVPPNKRYDPYSSVFA